MNNEGGAIYWLPVDAVGTPWFAYKKIQSFKHMWIFAIIMKNIYSGVFSI